MKFRPNQSDSNCAFKAAVRGRSIAYKNCYRLFLRRKTHSQLETSVILLLLFYHSSIFLLAEIAGPLHEVRPLLLRQQRVRLRATRSNDPVDHILGELIAVRDLTGPLCSLCWSSYPNAWRLPLSKTSIFWTPISKTNIFRLPLSKTNIFRSPLHKTNIFRSPLTKTKTFRLPLTKTSTFFTAQRSVLTFRNSRLIYNM